MRWKTKFLVPALAFVLTICLSSYLYLCFSAGRLLTAAEFWRFSGTILWNATLHSDVNGGARSLRLAREALSSPVPRGVVEISGRNYYFPLPKYSVCQENQHYLTFASFEELQNYFHGGLPAAGWRQVNQMGAGHFFEGDGARMLITHRYHLGRGIIEFQVSVVPQ
jgi:hypothetical protein